MKIGIIGSGNIGGTSSELIAQQLPGVPLVKAFNAMYSETLRTEGRGVPSGCDTTGRLVLHPESTRLATMGMPSR